ncbi:hypothetical protein [Oceanicoccus sp. KOV_DT_Chl]|uniref:hypothetical protein n=1 Tax=Oceanicoccus sp. KOV_DT_Chl TaxID=1904639 RepID=UPI000C7BBC7A|nr:hypothetical protein [Oceanicoccus sp. KOV_DT_Chl]
MTASIETGSIEQSKAELKASFDNMIAMFQQARDAIDQPELFPVPANDRNLAEGYRYVLGFILNGIERALGDPLYPRFRRAIQPMNRSTIDNADAVYLTAEIDGNHRYWLRGKAADSRHWRGEPAVAGRKAPQYVIFELSSGYAGDSGQLSEMKPGTRINTSTLDSSAIAVDEEGCFEILIAPEKPEDYHGNFMLSKKESRGKEFVGCFLTCRELFHDWENEDLLDLEILRIGAEREPRPPLDTKGAMAMMDKVGKVARNHVHFWNAFNTITLETYGKVAGGINSGDPDAKPFMPTNDMNPPNALGIATGGGQSTNIYAGGVYLLADDEALVLESKVPIEPAFMGFHLANLWGESLDFESYQSNLNSFLMESTGDDVYRWVVAHRDPGVANWIDTTGLPHGYMSMRWTYTEQPVKELWPSLTVKKISFDEITEHFPHAGKVAAEQRAATMLMRHKHVQRRYRQY